MVKAQGKAKAKKTAGAAGRRPRPAPSGQRKPPRPSSGSPALTAMMAYDRMIRDPCGAPPSRAPYQGTDSGLMARTIDYWNPSVGANSPNGDYVFQVTPAVYLATNVGPQASAMAAGGTGTIGNLSPPTNFVTTTAQKWRCLAMCLKWIPNGPYAARAGTVSLGYAASSVLTATTSTTSAALRAKCLETAGNGSKEHAIRWIPNANDQNWVGANVPTTPGQDEWDGASCFIALSGVDATSTAGASPLNGYFEVTAIWEWQPAQATNMAVAPVPPPAFTINQHQSTIGNIARYLLDGVRTVAGSAYVRSSGQQLLSKGWGAVTSMAPRLAALAL